MIIMIIMIIIMIMIKIIIINIIISFIINLFMINNRPLKMTITLNVPTTLKKW